MSRVAFWKSLAGCCLFPVLVLGCASSSQSSDSVTIDDERPSVAPLVCPETMTRERVCFLAWLARARGFPEHDSTSKRGRRFTGQRLLICGPLYLNVVQTLPRDITLHPLFTLLMTGDLLDGWGGEIHYRCPGVVNPSGWEVHSYGPDGVNDGGRGDDIIVTGVVLPHSEPVSSGKSVPR